MKKKFLIKSKKQMFTVIAVFTLILFVGGVSIAFFNYTRTGGANTVSTGRVSFTSSQETISFENIFPIDSTQAATDTTNAKTMSVTVTGDTDYENGLEYVITADDVNLSVNNKTLPIALEVSVANNSNLGTAETGDYYANRDSYTTSKYKVEYDGKLEDDAHILVGYIAPNTTTGTPNGTTGTINIKAYIDKDRILISDTYPEGNVTVNNQTYYNGTTNPNNKVVFTTAEWNAITGANALSFKIKVEANEGIWVDNPKGRNDMGNSINALFDTGGAFEGQKSSITEINFMRMREEEINTHANVVDLTESGGQGVVKGWIENNKLYIASSGETYFPVNSSSLFGGFNGVTNINFNNVNTSEVTSMDSMFAGCSSLASIELNSFDTSNVTSMASMFAACSSLTTLDLSYLDTSSLTLMGSMFVQCSNLVSINISGLGSNSLTGSLAGIFYNCASLTTINMSGFNFGLITDLNGFTTNMTSIEVIDFSDVIMNNITSMSGTFWGNSNLRTIYVSNTWNVDNVTNSGGMFSGCTSLVGGNGTPYDQTIVDKTRAIVDEGPTSLHPGYLTLKAS